MCNPVFAFFSPVIAPLNRIFENMDYTNGICTLSRPWYGWTVWLSRLKNWLPTGAIWLSTELLALPSPSNASPNIELPADSHASRF